MKFAHKNILITGGAGFIGSHLAERLAQDNFVRIVDDFSTGDWENLGDIADRESVEIIDDDINDRTAVKDWCADIDVVFHLAVSCLRTSLGDPEVSHEVNAGGTLNLCRGALACGVGRFVYLSSSEVYGTARQVPMSETHPLEPLTVYGATKLAGELYAKAFHRTYGLPVVIVRPFSTYGPREPWRDKRAEVIPRFILRILSGRAPIIFGDGAQTRDFCYVEDTVTGILAAAACEELVGDVVNIARGREVPVGKIALLIAEHLGTRLTPAHRPSRPGDITRHVADTSKARDLVGFEAPTDITEGLSRCIQWFKMKAADGSLLDSEAGDPNWDIKRHCGYATDLQSMQF